MRRIKTFIYTFAYIYISLPVCPHTQNIVIWFIIHLFYTKGLSSEVILLIFLHIFVSLNTSGAVLRYGVGGQHRRQ